MVKNRNKIKMILVMVFIGNFLYGGDKLDSLDKKMEEFYNNISKIEANSNKVTPSSKPKKVSEKDTTNDIKEKNEPTSNPRDVSGLQEDTKKFQNLKISSIYSFNSKNYVVFNTPDADGRYTINDRVLGYTIENINTRTKTITFSKDQDKNTKYLIDLSPEGVSWKKNH